MKILKDEKGFTLLEVILSVFIVSVALLGIFIFISDINKIDNMSKENHYGEKLIEPYISYYQNLEVKRSEVNQYISDIERDYLEGSNKDYLLEKGPDLTPKSFRNLKVYCDKDVVELDSKGNRFGDTGYDIIEGSVYLNFEIKCEVNGREVNKGKEFMVLKYIN